MPRLGVVGSNGFGLSLARGRFSGGRCCSTALPGAPASRVDTDAGLFEVKAALRLPWHRRSQLGGFLPWRGPPAKDSRDVCCGHGSKKKPLFFLPVLLPSLAQTVSPERGTPSPSHPAMSRPRWAMEIPNRPMSNFESGWRGGDVGGTGPARWKLATFRAELLLTQPGKTRVVLPAAIIFLLVAIIFSMWLVGVSITRVRKRGGERGNKKKSEGENRVGDAGTWVVAGDAHVSPLSLLADRFGGRPG